MARVPQFPGVLRAGDNQATTVRNATPVRGGTQWYEWAKAQVWLAGRGSQLISIGPYTGDMGSSSTWYCYAFPHVQILNWLWIVSLARTSDGAHVYGHFVGAGGTNLGSWVLDSAVERNTPQHFYFIESFSTMSDEWDFTFEINTDSTSHAVDLVGVNCSELPMHSITEFGSAPTALVEPNTCVNGAPIYEPASGRKSAHGLLRNGSVLSGGLGMIREARRCMLFSWAHPVGVDFTTTSFVDLFTIDPAVLARHLFNGTLTGTVRVVVGAATDGGDLTGEVRFTAVSGDTETVSIASGMSSTLEWFTGNLSVDTEHLSRNATDGGIRDGDRDLITVAGRVTGTTTLLRVYSIFILEAE